MRTIFVGLMMAGLLSVSGQTKDSAQKPAAVASSLPTGAEKVGQDQWKWKDPQGKTWMYYRTAFGYTRLEEVPDKESASPSGYRVVEVKSAEVTFERATPFGKSRWSRPVTDLNDDEKAALEAFKKAAKPAGSAK